MPEQVAVPFVSFEQPYILLSLFVSQSCMSDTVAWERVLEVFLPDTVSLRMDSILFPLLSDTLVAGTWVYPKVRILNEGNRLIENLPVNLQVYGEEGLPFDSITCYLTVLPERDTVDFLFPSGCKLPVRGKSCLLQIFIASLDSIATDDTLEQWYAISCDTLGLPIWKIDSWQLGQNLPNPATGMTQVPVTLPEPGRVLLQVHSVEGRLLYRGEYAVAEGKSLLSLDLAGYAAGVYYYSVEYRGERKVRKMVVE